MRDFSNFLTYKKGPLWIQQVGLSRHSVYIMHYVKY